MPFSNPVSNPMSGMSGIPSIAVKIGKAQQEGYPLTKKGTAVGYTPDISASIALEPEGPWSPPASSASPAGVAASENPAGLSLLWAAGGRSFARRGVACRPQKGDSAPYGLPAASPAAPLAHWSGGKSP
jgi:hypothetical protein